MMTMMHNNNRHAQQPPMFNQAMNQFEDFEEKRHSMNNDQMMMKKEEFINHNQFNMTTPTQHHLLCGQYGLTKQERKERHEAKTYKIRDDFIIETNYYDFYHKVERAFDNIHQPAFITHKAYPTNRKKAKHFNSDIRYNQEMFKMISKDMCEGSRRVFQEENAGGCSIFSETMSCEIVTRMFKAQLIKTEMEIDYVNEHCKKTDFLVDINGKKYGVSVTRAFKYIKPNKDGNTFDHFSIEDARILLKKKLEGVTTANKCVQNSDVWQKQILHIFTPNANVTKVLKRAYMGLKHSYRHNTIVMVTEANHMDCIFTERFYDHIF